MSKRSETSGEDLSNTGPAIGLLRQGVPLAQVVELPARVLSAVAS